MNFECLPRHCSFLLPCRKEPQDVGELRPWRPREARSIAAVCGHRRDLSHGESLKRFLKSKELSHQKKQEEKAEEEAKACLDQG